MVPAQRERRSGYLLSALYLRTLSRDGLSYSPGRCEKGFRSEIYPPLNGGNKEGFHKIADNSKLPLDRWGDPFYTTFENDSHYALRKAGKYGRCHCHYSHCDSGFFYLAQSDPQISERTVRRRLRGVFRRTRQLQRLPEASCRRYREIV